MPDSLASNYDPYSVTDDGSCTYISYGCLDSLAANYDSQAQEMMVLVAFFLGCTDATALNYTVDSWFENEDDEYGGSISITLDVFLAIGSPQDHNDNQDKGYVQVFQSINNSWIQIGQNVSNSSQSFKILDIQYL